MSIDRTIVRGDPLDADVITLVYQAFEGMANLVQPYQLRDGAIRAGHLTGTAKTLASDFGAGPFNPAAWTRVLPAGVAPWTTTAGEAVIVHAQANMAGAGAGPDVQLRLVVAGVVVVTRRYSLEATGRRVFNLAWVFQAPAGASTLIELEAQGTNYALTNVRLDVLAVQR